MSERYFITGVQLGMLVQKEVDEETKKKLMDIIIDKQFITNCHSNEDKINFKKKIREIFV